MSDVHVAACLKNGVLVEPEGMKKPAASGRNMNQTFGVANKASAE